LIAALGGAMKLDVTELGQPNGRVLRAMREYAGITQAELADILDTTVKHLDNVEKGKRWLEPAQILMLVKLIGKDGALHSPGPRLVEE
jgi:DNA-binding transcriptional regulator YiaG